MENRTKNILLWIIQLALALIFILSGVAKLYLPIEQLTAELPMPELFVRFLGVIEVLGGLGLVLPGIFGIKLYLTPLAAAGLVIVMVGATIISLMTSTVVLALIPLITGVLAAVIASYRWQSVSD